jgi:hypothetical protein
VLVCASGRSQQTSLHFVHTSSIGRTHIDKPSLRTTSLGADIRVGNERGALASRRIAALKKYGLKGEGPPALEPIPGASNWVQVGPMSTTPMFAIPERGLRLPILLSGTTVPGEIPPRFHVLQHFRRELVGGSAFVLVTRE